MFVKALKAKIHRATITETQLHYSGSIAIDSNLLNTVGICPYEAVIVADITTGTRAETYVVPAEPASGKIVVMGAAARIMNPGDLVIIMNFAFYTPEEAAELKPKVIVLDKKNKIKQTL